MRFFFLCLLILSTILHTNKTIIPILYLYLYLNKNFVSAPKLYLKVIYKL